MKTQIEVTQGHIDKGIRFHCSECPIALAIKDVVIDSPAVKVPDIDICRTLVIFNKDFQGTCVDVLPITTQKFVNNFDYGKEVKPFSFELDIPKEFLR